MSSRWRERAAIATVAFMLAGCEVAYVPGREETSVDPNATGEAALRELVSVRPAACDEKGARGTVSNRASRAVRVVVEVDWTTEAGATLSARASVSVAPGGESPFRVRSPKDVSGSLGCQVSAKEVSPAPP